MCSQRGASPDIPVDLEKIALFVRKANLAFLVETRFLEVVCQSAIISMSSLCLRIGHLLLIVHARLKHNSFGSIIR